MTSAPVAALLALSAASLAAAPGDADLGRYFGFEQPRFLVVDDDAGPFITADMNGDGLDDIVVVNNRKSRIEIHLQRAEPLTDAEAARQARANDLPPSRHYERADVAVSHRVTGVRAHDFDADGRLDLLYAGQPPELVIKRQKDDGRFEDLSKTRVPGLAAGRDGLAIADVMGEPGPEVVAVVAGRIHAFPLSPKGVLGEAVRLGSGGGSNQQIVAFFIEDYDGNDLLDILGVVPDDASPLRLWLQTASPWHNLKTGLIGPELRFDMAPLREADPVRLPGQVNASIAVIERTTRRLALYDLVREEIEPVTSPGGERQVQAEARAFPDGASKDRSVVVADIDADGLLDLLATDSGANSLLLYRQTRGSGLSRMERFSAFKKPKSVAAGQWNGEGPLEVFVLSEEEKAVGVSRFDTDSGRLGFPEPMPIVTAGASPVAMAFVQMPDSPAVAVVVQNRRDHSLELHRPGEAPPVAIALEGVNRPPQSILPADVDGDGLTDLLLFTPGEPMVMVRGLGGAEPPAILTDRVMPQFGLVQAAGPDNTALLDIDGDDRPELLIADSNFVRACSYDAQTGWRVVEQVTDPSADTRFVGLAVLDQPDRDPTIVVSDKAAGRLVTITRANGAWALADRMRLDGFDPRALHAGAFTGDGRPDILCLSDDAFGVVRLAGDRFALREAASWRSDDDNRLEHETIVGDINGDQFVDIIVLDAAEQMAQILTISASRRILPATEFKVFETRLFQGGDQREFEPSMGEIADVTGDGAPDLVLLCHDRVIVYPQMTAPEPPGERQAAR